MTLWAFLYRSHVFLYEGGFDYEEVFLAVFGVCGFDGQYNL